MRSRPGLISTVSAADLAATIYNLLEHDPRREIRDGQNRPSPLSTGAPLFELFD